MERTMDGIWEKLYEAAFSVQNPRDISGTMSAGGVSSAVESGSGKIYTGVCVDTACSLGICAERNAVFSMITAGEDRVKRVLTIMPDGKAGAPCGACREFLRQLMPDSAGDIEIMMDFETGRTALLSELTPEWWI